MHGVTVFAIAAGPDPIPANAPPARDVVLLHGLAVSHRYLEPALCRLAVDRRVFAPDLPRGRPSSRPQRSLSMVELVDGLLDWMDVVGVGQAVVIGHSLGCRVAAQLAARHPDRVDAVVLVRPGRAPGHRSVWQQAWWLLVDSFREPPSMVRIAITDHLRVGARQMCGRSAERVAATPRST